MKAEWHDLNSFVRVYHDDGSYALGSPIQFGVHVQNRGDVAWLEAGIGSMSLSTWRAIKRTLAAHGFRWAEWEETEQRDGKTVIIPMRRKVQ